MNRLLSYEEWELENEEFLRGFDEETKLRFFKDALLELCGLRQYAASVVLSS